MHPEDDKENDDIKKKRAAAKKLLSEKEKAIEEGIKQKMRYYEQEHIDEMLNKALSMNVEQEVVRRIKIAS